MERRPGLLQPHSAFPGVVIPLMLGRWLLELRPRERQVGRESEEGEEGQRGAGSSTIFKALPQDYGDFLRLVSLWRH